MIERQQLKTINLKTMIDLQDGKGFVIVGATTGQVIASQVGGIGVVGGFGGMALGTPVIVVGGAIAGAAVKAVIDGIETGDVTVLGVTTLGSVLGAGFSATVGNVGVGVAGSAFGVGLGTMAVTGGIFALGVYQLIKMFGRNSSQGKCIENLLFLQQITEEYELEQKWKNLEIEQELQELKVNMKNNLIDNNLEDYQWQNLETGTKFESLSFLQKITKEYEVERRWKNLEIEEELQALKANIKNDLINNNFVDYQWQNLDTETELENLKQQLKNSY